MMATYFGEILEPTSRAIFDEFSDEEDDTKPIDLRFYWFQTKNILPPALDTVFVYHGKLSVVFAEAYLLTENSSPIGEIKIAERSDGSGDEDDDDDDDALIQRKKALPTRVYLDDNIVTCLVSPAHSSESAFQYVNCMTPLLKLAKRVVVFTSEFSSNYRTAELKDLPPAFVKQLKTSHGPSDFIVEELPVPNIVAGIPAAIASWCQINRKDASLFVCYADQPKLDSVTSLPYVYVLNKLNPRLIKNANPDLSSKKFYGNPDVIGGSSNIYI